MALESRKGPGKKAVKIAGGKMLEMGGGGAERTAGGAQGPWSVTPEASNCEQHGTPQSNTTSSAVTSLLLGKEAKPSLNIMLTESECM